MELNLKYNKDFIIFVGNNGSGKTTLMRSIISKMPLKRVFVINSGAEKSWYNLNIPKENIIIPAVYDNKTFNKLLYRFIINRNINSFHLAIDDADNFELKDSRILKSVYVNARRLNLGGSLSVRRLSWIPIEIYDKAKYIFFSRQNVDYSIYYIQKLMGRDLANKLKKLDQFVFLVYEPTTGNNFKMKLKV